MKMAKPCRVERYWAGYEQCPKRLRQTFTRGKVGFLAIAYMPIGGTEVWHQTLLPRLDGVAGFVALEANLAKGDFSRLPCDAGIGMQAARALAESVDVLVAWGIGSQLGEILPANRPRVISVSHCDGRSDWTRQMMAGQARWTDHAVFLCPSGRNTCPAGIPATQIANAPDPERVKSSRTRQAAREHFGVRDSDKLLVSFSRLSPEKGLAALVQAMDVLPREYRLIIAGSSYGWSSDHAACLRELAGDRVHFVGNIDPPGDMLVAADAVVSASEYEGYGLSMAESMLAGVPVISTPVGLLEESPESAAIVPHRSTPCQWADAIAADFADPAGQKARAKQARQGVNTVQRFVDAWQRTIDSVCAVAIEHSTR